MIHRLPQQLKPYKPNFEDFVPPEEQKELEHETDKSVQRIEHHEGFILKKHLPYGHWKVTCEDGTDTPAELAGVFVRSVDAKRAIYFHLEKLSSETSA